MKKRKKGMLAAVLAVSLLVQEWGVTSYATKTDIDTAKDQMSALEAEKKKAAGIFQPVENSNPPFLFLLDF